ncbi:MAG: phosphonoacetaldehyde hydrolase [Fimbriiglobus sp.]|nr:phosphonoacetaldehyde hydrolase [Fimbriiglobus sp.]
MSASPEIKLVVLDWAGTVIDFGCMAPSGAFVAAFGEAGVNVSVAEARGPMGLHKKDHIRAMLQMPAIGERWRQAHNRDWTEGDINDLYRRVTPMQVAAAGKYSALIPGVIECVAELRKRGIQVAGTTGYFREAADVVYAAAREQGYAPDFVICADEVPAGRPAPWMIFRCMEALGVYPPAAVVKVGDTAIDIEDGRNAGVWSVGVIDSSNEMGRSESELAELTDAEREERREAVLNRYEDAGCDAAIRHIGQLPRLIDEINEHMANGARPGG